MSRRIIIAVWLLVVTFFASGLLLAQTSDPPSPTSPIEIPFSVLLGGNTTMEGMLAEQDLWVQLPYNWTLSEDVVVNLAFQSSEILETNLSSLTIGVNGSPITSRRLTITEDLQTVSFLIPPELIYQGSGFNLEFNGYLRLTPLECEESRLPAQWLTLSQTSRVTIIPDAQPGPPELAQLARTLASDSPLLQDVPIIIAVPDTTDSTVLTIAAQVVSRLSQQRRGALPRVSIRPFSELTPAERQGANIIAIGTFTANEMVSASPYFDGTGFVTVVGTPVSQENGVIELMTSPFSPQRVLLIISGGTPNALRKAGTLFAALEAYELLGGRTAYIGEAPRLNTTGRVWEDSQASLADLGFPNRTTYGIGTSDINYRIARPRGWVLEEGAEITISIAFSPLGEGSHINFSMNGIPVATQQTGPGVIDRTFTFPLPVAELNDHFERNPSQDFNLQAEVVHLLDITHCQQFDQRSVWTRINNSTTLNLPHSYAQLPNIAEFPYPFVNAESVEPLVFVLPEVLAPDDLPNMLQLVAYLGQNAQHDFDMRVVTADQVSDEDLAQNLIVYGMRNNQPILELVLAQLETDEALIDGQAGVIRQAASPFQSGRTVLLIYGDTAEQLDWAYNHLMYRLLPDNVSLSYGGNTPGLMILRAR